MNEYFNREAYASYEQFAKLPYNIISFLMFSPDAEIIWKCLKYDSSDAWKKPNLTQAEKGKLIYSGTDYEPDSTLFRVFMDEGQDDAISTVQTLLRIFPMESKPVNRTVGITAVHFQVMSHFKTNTMNNYQTKVDTIIQALIKGLNGANVETLGALFFDSERYPLCGIRNIGITPFRGKMLTMAVNMG